MVLPLVSSCEKIIFEEDKASKNPQENFNYLWNECDEKYSYFDLKNINWDEKKIEYSSKCSFKKFSKSIGSAKFR